MKDPFNFTILVAFVPMLSILLFTCQVVLMSLEYISVADKYMAEVSREDGGGLSMCSWYHSLLSNPNCRADPGMFNRGILKVKAAKKTMGASRTSF